MLVDWVFFLVGEVLWREVDGRVEAEEMGLFTSPGFLVFGIWEK